MDKEEFNGIQNELINQVINFEQTERSINFLNSLYILRFYQELEQQRYLLFENEYLVKSIAMDADGKTVEEVKAFLEKSKNDFSLYIERFHKQYELAKEMESQLEKYTKEDLEKNDASFIEYCTYFHPLVKTNLNSIDSSIYSSLIMLYRMGNIAGFKNVMKECKDNLHPALFKEENYDEVSKLYKESIEYLNSIKEKKMKEFPLNKKDIFNNEDLITRELIYLREKNYKIKEMNQSLQADFKLHFSFEFSL